MSAPYVLHGFKSSPYSVKMRAILRYRRIPFVWDSIGNPRDVAVAANLPPVIPILRFPDGRLMNDSTPLAYALEREHRERSIIPDDLRIYADELERQHGDWSPHYRGRILWAFLVGLFERCGLRIGNRDVMH